MLPPSARLHHRHDFLDEQERALAVDGEDAVPVVRGMSSTLPPLADRAGHVHQHVDPPAEGLRAAATTRRTCRCWSRRRQVQALARQSGHLLAEDAVQRGLIEVGDDVSATFTETSSQSFPIDPAARVTKMTLPAKSTFSSPYASTRRSGRPKAQARLVQNVLGPGSSAAGHAQGPDFEHLVQVADAAGRLHLHVGCRMFAHPFQVFDRRAGRGEAGAR